MKVLVRRYNFAEGTVLEYDREIPDSPPDTPLMSMLRKKAAVRAAIPQPPSKSNPNTPERNDE